MSNAAKKLATLFRLIDEGKLDKIIKKEEFVSTLAGIEKDEEYLELLHIQESIKELRNDVLNAGCNINSLEQDFNNAIRAIDKLVNSFYVIDMSTDRQNIETIKNKRYIY